MKYQIGQKKQASPFQTKNLNQSSLQNKKIDDTIKLKLLENQIQNKNEIKILRVTFDKKMKWIPQSKN